MKKEQQVNKEKVTQAKIAKIEKQLAKLPQGEILCVKNGIHTKWFEHRDGELVYLPKSERARAEQLALKKYLRLEKEKLEFDMSYQKKIENYQKRAPKSAISLLENGSPYQDLLEKYFQPKNIELAQWAKEPYEKCLKYPEQLKIKAMAGNIVRSKSESSIITSLVYNKIPFRYECPLNLNGQIIYPDFTIRHPKTGEIRYWEHFGLMDEPSYAQNTAQKIKQYCENGIYPSVNLIMTFETKHTPLSPTEIEEVVQHYFL